MNDMYIWSSIAISALVTAGIRFLPFVVFGGERKLPKTVEKLGNLLPYAIMGMLVVFCLKGVSLTAAPHGIPEAIACVLVETWFGELPAMLIGAVVVFVIRILAAHYKWNLPRIPQMKEEN